MTSARYCLLSLFVALLACSECAADIMPGSVFVTRNRNEAENLSPGHFNHLAIYVGNGIVIESQGGIVEHGLGRGVIRTQLGDFLSRDYVPILILEPVEPAVGLRAAAIAETLVGLPFRKWSSLPGVDRARARQRGMNCDSVIRYSFRQASGMRLRRLRIPDRALMYADGRLFREPKVLR